MSAARSWGFSVDGVEPRWPRDGAATPGAARPPQLRVRPGRRCARRSLRVRFAGIGAGDAARSSTDIVAQTSTWKWFTRIGPGERREPPRPPGPCRAGFVSSDGREARRRAPPGSFRRGSRPDGGRAPGSFRRGRASLRGRAPGSFRRGRASLRGRAPGSFRRGSRPGVGRGGAAVGSAGLGRSVRGEVPLQQDRGGDPARSGNPAAGLPLDFRGEGSPESPGSRATPASPGRDLHSAAGPSMMVGLGGLL